MTQWIQPDNNVEPQHNHYNTTRTRDKQRGPTTTPHQCQQWPMTTTKDDDGSPRPAAPINGHNGPPTPPPLQWMMNGPGPNASTCDRQLGPSTRERQRGPSTHEQQRGPSTRPHLSLPPPFPPHPLLPPLPFPPTTCSPMNNRWQTTNGHPSTSVTQFWVPMRSSNSLN